MDAPKASEKQQACDQALEVANAALHDHRLDDADRALTAALAAAEACGAADPRNAVVLHHLGVLRGMQSRLPEAQAALEGAVLAWERAVGADDPHVCSSLTALGQVLAIQEKPALALPVFTRCLTIIEKTRGPAHAIVASCLHNVATQLQELGRHTEAIPHFEAALRLNPDYRLARENLTQAKQAPVAPPRP